MYAGFWKRFFAFLIDSFIVCFVAAGFYILIFALVMGAGGREGSSFWLKAAFGFIYLFSLFFPILYWSVFEASSRQATPGKMALGIKVCCDNGEPLDFKRSLSRNLCKLISNLTLYIGYFMAGFTVRKQALHDKMAHCFVVSKNADIKALAPLPKTPLWLVASVILAVLMPFFFFFALAAALIFGAFRYNAHSLESFNLAVDNLRIIKNMQNYYKIKNGVYADRAELLLFGPAAPVLDGGSVEDKKFFFPRSEDYSYRLVPGGVSAEHKLSPHYSLTLCYDSNKRCLDIETERFKNIYFTLASPEECCGKTKEE